MKNNINFTGKITALVSFVTGTIFLALYLYYGETIVNIYIAFLFVIAALIINTVIVAVIVGRVILIESQRLDGIKTIFIMLANIPVSALYFYIIITFPGHKFLL